jgi:hypothetical protein
MPIDAELRARLEQEFEAELDEYMDEWEATLEAGLKAEGAAHSEFAETPARPASAPVAIPLAQVMPQGVEMAQDGDGELSFSIRLPRPQIAVNVPPPPMQAFAESQNLLSQALRGIGNAIEKLATQEREIVVNQPPVQVQVLQTAPPEITLAPQITVVPPEVHVTVEQAPSEVVFEHTPFGEVSKATIKPKE